MLYNAFINYLLLGLESAGLGMRIGNIYLGAPTFANDVLPLSDCPHEFQAILDLINSYACTNRYQINPNKSTTTVFPECRAANLEQHFHLGQDTVPHTKAYTHLGLTRASHNPRPNIKGRISLGRCTAYSLMGIGVLFFFLR